MKCSFSWEPSASPLWMISLPSQVPRPCWTCCMYSASVFETLKCFPDSFNVLYLDKTENCAVNPASREQFLRVIWKVSFLALALSLTQTFFYSFFFFSVFISFYWNKHRKKQPPFFSWIFYMFAEAKSSTRKRGCGWYWQKMIIYWWLLQTYFKLLWIYSFLIFFLKNFIEV